MTVAGTFRLRSHQDKVRILFDPEHRAMKPHLTAKGDLTVPVKQKGIPGRPRCYRLKAAQLVSAKAELFE